MSGEWYNGRRLVDGRRLTLNRHPFDTIKVRLQTSSKEQFKGPIDCLLQTIRKEGVNGIYKGGKRLPGPLLLRTNADLK